MGTGLNTKKGFDKKIVAEIKNYTSGSIRYYTGAGTDVSRSFSSDGVHTHYLIANSTKVLFYSDLFNGSIDNVKVYKVNLKILS